MLISADEADNRLSSPGNLLNRLREVNKFKPAVIVSIPAPKSEELIPDINEQLADGLTVAKAKRVLNQTLDALSSNVDNIKPDRLSAVAKDMSTIINAGKEKGNSSNRVQVIVYNPEPAKVTDYETITL